MLLKIKTKDDKETRRIHCDVLSRKGDYIHIAYTSFFRGESYNKFIRWNDIQVLAIIDEDDEDDD